MLRRRKNLVIKCLLLVPMMWVVVIYFLIVQENKANVEPSKSPVHVISNMLNLPVIKSQYSKELKTMRIQSKEVNNNVERGQGFLLPPNDLEGPGEMGKPVQLTDITKEQQEKIDYGWETYAFNQYVSDMISIHRSLPDPRDKECHDIQYPIDELPTTSVIICFYNEAWSSLLRTFHSVLERSPPHLIKEIILVDDFSDLPHLNETLDRYVTSFPKIKIIRAQKREGLIRARLLAAAVASAPVLTYLDSHCECAEGWLEPLLYQIYLNKTNVLCPVIDVISDDTLEFHYRHSTDVHIGGFNWDLHFNWHSVPKRLKKIRPHSYLPVDSPTMAGGLFSIDKSFFEKIGTYDSGFNIWGGENLELSFKTWMCGGTLQIIPCSHVGHIFRGRSPYKAADIKRNSVRLAEVWLDDYAKFYYERIDNELGEYGDVTSRRELRKRLQCKSFKWYLDNVYPELFVPSDAIASGEVRNLAEGSMCLDCSTDKSHRDKPVGLYRCHGFRGNQFWMLSATGEIRRDDYCLDYFGTDIFLYDCHGAEGNQKWMYNPKNNTIHHGGSALCLAMHTDNKRLIMAQCSDEPRQKWKFQNYDPSKDIRKREF